MPEQIPAELAQLIDDYVESLVQLEALFLLRRDSQRARDAGDLAKSLYISRDMCESQLAGLERSGFVQRTSPPDAKFQYRPKDVETDRLIGELAALYQERRVAVISRIYSKPVNKVRTFADAFRLRKEE